MSTTGSLTRNIIIMPTHLSIARMFGVKNTVISTLFYAHMVFRPASLPLAHLVAISMDRHGMPQRLFTTNRWVTGEVWYDASAMARLIDCFEVDQALPSWPTNTWITNLLRLFLPLIENMLIARDEAVHAYASAHPGVDVYEDRQLEICSIVDISIEAQVLAIADALGR